MRYGSVCSGIEAATQAWHPLGWTPVFFSEIEAFPSAVLAHHYGSNMPGEPLAKNGIPNHGDFTTIGPEAGPIDLLVGGTPCQSFSVAGKRLGLDDPRGNLALEYLSLARRLRARWIVWENVPGVLSSVSDEEDGESGIQPGLEGREPGDEWIEESDFATFLSFVRECGYGFAYRVLDAQYVRVDGFERAVPQRRRRVFVVGYLGDWRRAAAVLLEPEGMRGDSAPSRQPGQRTAPTIASRPTGGGGLGTDFDLDGGLIAGLAHCRDVAGAITSNYGKQPDNSDSALGPNLVAFGGGNRSGPIDVSTALTAHGQRQDFEVETFIAEVAATLNDGGNSSGGDRQPGTTADTAGSMLVAHSLRGEGFDASEDGTGRGTPIVPVSFGLATSVTPKFAADISPTLTIPSPTGGGQPMAVAYGIRSDATRAGEAKTPSADASGAVRLRNPGMGITADVSPTVDASAAHAVAFAHQGGGDQTKLGYDPDSGTAMTLSSNQTPAVHQQWAVRRLMPVECERLQGFPDNFTNVPWGRKETAPDGPRYKALGNSMAVNVMRWIGQRIAKVDEICVELDREAAE